MKTDDYFMAEALREAEKSLKEGGIPIGAVLVRNGEIISRGHNRLIQNGSVILHAEMDAIENAGRLNYDDYIDCTLYTTLSPCPMCSGAVILYNIPRVVIGENTTLMGAESFLECNGVEVKVLNDIKCRDMFLRFAANNSEIWDEELKKVGNTTEVNINGDNSN
ncbi:MAG: nucleoside deaminase [Methanobrevibacter sp.]|nr:nucleoside deaminase [Methanobrevibacter sp.]